LESQVKASHGSLEESLAKILAMEAETEQVRSRVTEIAELFERKEIKTRYSFEVLCDFIYDKAKKLFLKYESAVAKAGKSNSSENKRIENEELK
jgi:hypothetical protein